MKGGGAIGLTPKEELFVQGLVEGLSQRKAYLKAYNCKNMKDATIDNKASKLFAKEEIRARYEKLINEYAKEAKWNRGLAEQKLLWLLDKSQESIELMGLKQANSSSMLNTIKELNTLTDLYPKDKVANKEDKLDKYLNTLEKEIKNVAK